MCLGIMSEQHSTLSIHATGRIRRAAFALVEDDEAAPEFQVLVEYSLRPNAGEADLLTLLLGWMQLQSSW